MNQELHCYHSFPRPRHDNSDQHGELLSRGLGILRSIRDMGLVLAPEVVEWSYPPDTLGVPPPHRILQRRISFTVLRNDELGGHAAQFGPFAIEFTIEGLLSCGALPVMHVPEVTRREDKHAFTGQFAAIQAGQMAGLINSLIGLQKGVDMAKAHGLEKITLNNPGRTFEVPTEGALALLDWLAFERAQPKEMIAATTILRSLMYPSGSERRSDDRLAYYRQREWRITDGYSINGVPRGRGLEEQEKRRLLSIDPHFWGRQEDPGEYWEGEGMKRGERPFKRLGKAAVLNDPSPAQVMKAFKRILAPREALDAAKNIFADYPEIVVESSPWDGCRNPARGN